MSSYSADLSISFLCIEVALKNNHSTQVHQVSKNHRTFPKRFKSKIQNAQCTYQYCNHLSKYFVVKIQYEISVLIQLLQVMRDQLKSTEYHYIKYDARGEGEESKQLKKVSLPSYIKEDLANPDNHNKIL